MTVISQYGSRLDDADQTFRNEVYSDELFEIVFDVDANNGIAGIDILDASERVNLAALLPVKREPRQDRAS